MDHGKTWDGDKMCHQKYENFDDFREFSDFSKNTFLMIFEAENWDIEWKIDYF